MSKGAGLQMGKVASDPRSAALSPSANVDQQRLLQKLQYRSMRGRRIKEYLQQV